MKNLFAILILFTSIAQADQLSCVFNVEGGGWSLRNETRKFNFGGEATVYFSKEVCERALSTLRQTEKGVGVVCGPNPNGTSLYRLDGNVVGDAESWFYRAESCVIAVNAMKDGVVCVPSVPGSGLYDLNTNNFIGELLYYDIYYFKVKVCSWASASASSLDSYVCGPHKGGSAIYDRKTGLPRDDSFFKSAEVCFKSLRGN